jgi:hypothetical protein
VDQRLQPDAGGFEVLRRRAVSGSGFWPVVVDRLATRVGTRASGRAQFPTLTWRRAASDVHRTRQSTRCAPRPMATDAAASRVGSPRGWYVSSSQKARSLRTDYRLMSRLALSNRSGGMDARPLAIGGVHLIEQRRELHQRSIREAFDRSQRMVRRNQRLGIDERQHAGLLLGPPSQPPPLLPLRYPPHPPPPEDLAGPTCDI